ncbi:hypothetical protein [Streptomyces sp. NBC_00474]|uniref:hypothetical protein n=1 Tax=Streptomyces sp. NBC_00474 TaxID=2975754 RepID=UPI00224F868D|nr:hypothetical protein [Streptomyces sp. NBC_00474]MCX5055104.1 hypothetical protein [Streptomyces sp. NBC_00474]
MGVGHDLVHSLDYVVLLQVMFNLASGVDSTPLSVWEQLKVRGIRSAKNARELVGKNAVYESFGRLLDAGYVRRQQLPHPTLPGRKGPVVYEVYDNPAWNPDWAPDSDATDHEQVKPQVATLPGTPDPLFGEASKPAGQDASRNAGSVNAGSGVPGSVKRRVPAGQDASQVPGSGIGSPPHPPEEEESSSSNLLPDPSGALPSQRDQQRGERAPEFTAEELRAAVAFLQGMRRWQAGAATAKRCAPRLLRTMRAQGWPALAEMDDAQRELLEADVLKNTGGAASWVKCLPGWVEDLRRYAVVKPRTAAADSGAGKDGTAVRLELVAACTACDRNGWVLDDDDDGPMRRCTHPQVSTEAEVSR